MTGAAGRRLALAAVLLVGLAVRLPGLSEPPLDFHPTRQYRSALIARDMYLQRDSDAPQWQRDVSSAARRTEGLIEPPVMEVLATGGYLVLDRETLVVPRVIGIVVWLVGVWFVYLLGLELASAGIALGAAAVYALIPYGVKVSRSFQPEALLATTMALALLMIVRHERMPTRRSLVLAAVAAALAGFVKPVSLPFTVGLFAAFVLTRGRRAVARQVPPFAAVAALPFVAWQLYGLYGAGFLEGQSEGRFLPQLYDDADFWQGWYRTLDTFVSLPLLAIVFVGAVAMSVGVTRRFLVATLLAYVGYALVFPFHVSTHDYYQVPLMPALAVGAAVFGGAVVTRLSVAGMRIPALAGVVFVLVALVSGAYALRPVDRDAFVRRNREVGRRLNHTTDAVMLADAYGNPLRYDGRIAGPSWPGRDDEEYAHLRGRDTASVTALLNQSARSARWFVVTDFTELRRQPELADSLERYPVAFAGLGYRVYDLQP